MGQLTDKQQKMLDVLTEYIEKNGKSPTLGELVKLMGVKHTREVTQWLDVLEKRGFIYKTAHKYRNIRLGSGLLEDVLTYIPIIGIVR